ncbi:putative inactive poly [ADP-ribose] polymerase SRO5 [Bidens hawaiensis]|uniref:putative inactive poly [ADP-ribose] polymerase SRO5 n=1 Tax=Bidens hawaiensis TaxID=980011 RepID=UPI004049D7FC
MLPAVTEDITSSYGSDNGVYVPVIEDSVSDYNGDGDGEDESSISDCESVTSGSRIMKLEQTSSFRLIGMVKVDVSDKLHEIIGKKFVDRLGYYGIDAEIECIHRNLFDVTEIALARFSSFRLFSNSVEKKNGGDANVKFAWFGGSKEEIVNIVVHGFGCDNIRNGPGSGSFGCGIVLSADHSPLESVDAAIVDEDGIKHLLLCRVLMGKSEVVNRGSTQCYPSSDEFQSGVDDLVSPKRIIIWSSQMNTHILPEFVVSFKTLTRSKSDGVVPVRVEKPVSPWIPIPNLLAALSKILAPKAMEEIMQFRRSYLEHKICRRDMIKGIGEVTGDRLLLMVLKDFTKQRRSNQVD